MGKRKSAKQAPKRQKYALPTEFDCKFCDHKQCVDVKLQRSKNMGTANCRVCKKSFATGINHLHERADVYCAWMDAIEEQQNEEKYPENKERQIENSDQDDDDFGSSEQENLRKKKIKKDKEKKQKAIMSSSEEDSLEDMVND